MHYIGLNDYMMKVFDMNDIVFTHLLMYELYVKYCGLMIGLLSMCEFMGIHIYIALVKLDVDCEKVLKMFYVKWNWYMWIISKAHSIALLSWHECVL